MANMDCLNGRAPTVAARPVGLGALLKVDRCGAPDCPKDTFKPRRTLAEQSLRKWVFQNQSNGDVEISAKQADGIDMLLQWARDGLTSCSEIAEEMGLSEGAVSKMATKLAELARLKTNGRQYALP